MLKETIGFVHQMLRNVIKLSYVELVALAGEVKIILLSKSTAKRVFFNDGNTSLTALFWELLVQEEILQKSSALILSASPTQT